MTKYESTVKRIYAPVAHVYAKFSDLTNLSTIQERMADPAFVDMVRQQAGSQVNDEQLARMQEIVSKLQFDRDSVTADAGPMGRVSLCIVEREEPKLVKYAAENSPVPANLWIQLLPNGEGQTAMKVTLGVELNFLMKQMLKGKLQDGVERLADMLAMIGNS
ncbi:MAG: SRPBCC family protein [Bacteroidaceae bacterium]|nr:SRPBCC family protein [Bacteroidaceae bacterium]